MKNQTTHWTKDQLTLATSAKTFDELLSATLAALEGMPQPLCMVSGPISSGGEGSVEKNLKLFAHAREALHKSGLATFDQLALHDTMMRLLQNSKNSNELLTSFYLPLLQSGVIQRVYFLPDWKSSKGASWEYTQCKKLNIEHVDFPKELL